MTVAELVVKIGAEDTGLQRGLRQAQAQMKGFKRIGEGMSSVGASMSKYVTLPLIVAGAASAKFAIDFQKDMEMVHTQAGASQNEVNRLSNAVLNLAKTVPQSPEELAKGLFHLESVGMRGKRAMDALKVAALGAATGNSDLEDTTNALAGALVTGIRGAHNFKGAMALLNATVGAGNMRMADLATSLRSGVLPAAKTAGLGLKDVLAPMALLSDEGVPANVAATRLRMTFSLMAAPTKQAAKALKSVGLSSTDMAREMRGPKGLIGALQLLHDHLDGLSKVKQEQVLSKAFGGGRTSATIMSLLNNLPRLQQKMGQITKTAGRFGEDVARTQQTAAYKLQAAWSSIQVAMIKVGAAIMPVFVELANTVAGLADAFSRLSPAAQHWVVVGLAIIATVGPILYMLGKMILLGRDVAAVLMLIDGAALPWIALGVAIVAIGVALVIAYKKVSWFHSAVDHAFHAIKTVVNVVVGFIRHHWQTMLTVLTGGMNKVAEFIINHWNTIKRIGGQAVDFIKQHWRQLILALGPVGLAVDIVTKHFGTFKRLAGAALGWIHDRIGNVKSAISALRSAASGPLNAIKGWFSDIASAVERVVGWISRIHFPSPPGWVKSIAGKVGGFAGSVGGAIGVGATGGIVTRPTLAMIGEAGYPEAVVPLNRTQGSSPLPAMMGGAATVNVNLHFHGGMWERSDARRIARQLEPELGRIVKAAR